MFVGLGIDRNLIQHQFGVVGIRRQHPHPWHLVSLRAAKFLAIDADFFPSMGRAAATHPLTKYFLEYLSVQRFKQVVKARAARRPLTGETQRRRKRLPPIASELSDGVKALSSRQDRHCRKS